MRRALAYGRLLRISLAPSALADIAAGCVLGAGEWPGGAAPFVLMLASACVYHGGMALNDWADRDEDARNARPRPIPRGEVRAGAALVLALGLLALGCVLGFAAAPRAGACLAAVALVAAAYDLCARGAWLGPLCLGACRAGNLGAGILLGSEHAHGTLGALVLPGNTQVPGTLLAALLYGLYVFSVSRVARLEDAPASERDAARPGRGLLLAAFLLAALGLPRLVAGLFAGGSVQLEGLSLACALAGAAIAFAGAAGLARAGLRGGSWPAADVMRAVGMALRRLLVATSALAAQAGSRDGLVVAALILCGYPLSFGLRRLFPPT